MIAWIAALAACGTKETEGDDGPTEAPADGDGDADTDADADVDTEPTDPWDTGAPIATGDTAPAPPTDSGTPATQGGTQVFDVPGEAVWAVPAGVRRVTVIADGAGGGGLDARPWGVHTGGEAAHVEVELPVTAGQDLVVRVGGPGRGVSCGGGTPGAGGGGLSGVFDAAYAPLALAAGGGGAAESGDGCHAGAGCGRAGPAGGDGFGGGGARSDPTATHGAPGEAPPGFAGGAVGAGNCGGAAGDGGAGGGGGGGGTHNGFGGGGGGAGWPGGPGGASGVGGHAGTSFVDPAGLSPALSRAVGSGGAAGADGLPGRVELRW